MVDDYEILTSFIIYYFCRDSDSYGIIWQICRNNSISTDCHIISDCYSTKYLGSRRYIHPVPYNRRGLLSSPAGLAYGNALRNVAVFSKNCISAQNNTAKMAYVQTFPNRRGKRKNYAGYDFKYFLKNG